MAICKDCVHYDICGNKKCNFMTEETTREGLDFPCSDYKDISRFVEVVRCKECLYATEQYGHLKCIHGVSFRNCWNKPDDFCCHGVRKDGE